MKNIIYCIVFFVFNLSTSFAGSTYMPATGTTTSSDSINGVLIPKFKLQYGIDGQATDVSGANPLPVTISASQLGQTVTASSFSVVIGSQGFGDSAAVDAFSRLRVSNPETIFNSKQIFDNMPLFWDDQQTSGSGTTSTYNQQQASSTLAVSNATAGTRVRQTKRRFNYQPGKSQLYLFTGVFGAGATGITKRIGAFDSFNGVFFEQSGTTLQVCIRSSTSGIATDSCVSQDNFNKDKLNGTGPSRVTFLPASTQIFWFDYEWLGTGRIRFGIIYRGQYIVAHEVYNSNESGISVVWASNPNFPLRWEISNSGAGPASSLVQICATVMSEGGQEAVGFSRSIDRGSSGFATTAGNNDIYPLISMRLKPTNISATVSQMRVSVISATNANFRWGLYLNPTIAGTDAVNWVSDPNTSVEYDISRNATNKLSGGALLDSGYGSDAVNQIAAQTADQIKLGATIAGVPDQLVLGIQTVGATTTETYWPAITFLEEL